MPNKLNASDPMTNAELDAIRIVTDPASDAGKLLVLVDHLLAVIHTIEEFGLHEVEGAAELRAALSRTVAELQERDAKIEHLRKRLEYKQRRLNELKDRIAEIEKEKQVEK